MDGDIEILTKYPEIRVDIGGNGAVCVVVNDRSIETGGRVGPSDYLEIAAIVDAIPEVGK